MAFKRVFDSEEHTSEICMRDLMGENFTFLTACEHYFCTECMRELIVSKINVGNIKELCCAIASCKKSLNDLDIKNVGLD